MIQRVVFHDNAGLKNRFECVFPSAFEFHNFLSTYQHAGGFRHFEYDLLEEMIANKTELPLMYTSASSYYRIMRALYPHLYEEDQND